MSIGWNWDDWYFLIDTKEYFVIKAIDIELMSHDQALEAIEEISVQSTIDSPFVVRFDILFIGHLLWFIYWGKLH